LKNKVSELIQIISSKESIDLMPPGIRVIAGYISEFAKKYTPAKTRPLIGGFVMLRCAVSPFFLCLEGKTHPIDSAFFFLNIRYINVALMTPDNYGLLPKGKNISNISRRNLTLITKILQVSSHFFLSISFDFLIFGFFLLSERTWRVEWNLERRKDL
jgi:hypothetical protein